MKIKVLRGLGRNEEADDIKDKLDNPEGKKEDKTDSGENIDGEKEGEKKEEEKKEEKKQDGNSAEAKPQDNGPSTEDKGGDQNGKSENQSDSEQLKSVEPGGATDGWKQYSVTWKSRNKYWAG